MTDKPILFSAPMIRALLEGRKTQTRRVLSRARVFATPEQPAFTLQGPDLVRALQNASRFRRIEGDGWFWEADAYEWQAPHKRTGWLAHIGYAPGDQLWVREGLRYAKGGMCYAADEVVVSAFAPRHLWPYKRPHLSSRFMPRWASRLTLLVKDVRVERVQEITAEDAKAEGVEPQYPDAGDLEWARENDMPMDPGDPVWLAPGTRQGYGPRRNDPQWGPTPQFAFRCLWNSINEKRGHGWDANPWVTAISFEVIKANIDSLDRAA